MAARSQFSIVRGGFITALTLWVCTPVAFKDATAAEPSIRFSSPSAVQIRATQQTAAKSSGGLFSLASTNARKEVINGLPMHRLTDSARQRIEAITRSPTIFRRLPTQAIDCDRDMFLFLSRNPEVLVGMWDLMGITNVTIKRLGPYKLEATDGSGTQCVVDLVYGDANQHIFVASGSYDGRLVAKPIRGHGVFVMQSSYAKSSSGGTTVTGSIDCFVKFDSIGADLVARTLSGLIGRSADNNFIETARFVSQVSQASERNPPAMLDLADRLPQVTAPKRSLFAQTITTVARRGIESREAAQASVKGAAKPIRQTQYQASAGRR